MDKNQKQNVVIRTGIASLIIYLFLCPSDAFSDGSIGQADSLFNAGKFTESFKVYESVLEGGEYSSGMLIRMAYISEGLGDYSNALYFLNLYYDKTSDKRVWSKMQELATEHGLSGYEYGDADVVFNFYKQFHQYFLSSVALLSILLIVGLFRRRISGNGSSLLLGVLNFFVLVGFFMLLNYSVSQPKGIIVGNDTYLMSGPSSGADLVDVLQVGHRVVVIEDNDIWVKILWQDKEVFIRKAKIRQLV